MRAAVRVLVFGLVLGGLSARADWPMTRRDGRRSGEVSEPASLRTPVVAFRRYLGGELGADQFVPLDVDGDGSVEVVLIAGGKLVAKRPDDTVLWETEPLALSSIVHVADLDADGREELIVVGESAFLGIIDARSGNLRWRLAPGTFGTVVGSVRLVDLDGDGKDELYAADNACGSVNGKPRAMAWRFTGGFGPVVDDGSRRLFELPANREYHCGVADVVADLDGDGAVELVAFGIRRAYVYDGRTGQPLPSGESDPGYDLGFSIPYGVMRTELAPLPGGRRAIVAATNNSYDVSINSRALFVMTWERAGSTQARRLQLAWRRGVVDLANDRHAFGARLAVDLDADGTPEVVSSFTEGGRTSTFVFELLTGAVKARLDDATFAGVVELSPGAETLLVSAPGGLQGHRFAGFSGAFPPPGFTLPAANLLPVVDRGPRRATNLGTRWATVPLSGGGRALVVNRNQAVEAWSTEGTPAIVHALPIPAGIGVRGVSLHRGVAGAAEGLLLARSDGYLLALNERLEPVNFSTGELALPGMRTGGAYSGPRGFGAVPITARFDGGADELLARDSLGRLLRLDPSSANLVSEPREVWSWPGAAHPLALDVDGDGRRDLLVAFEGRAVVAKTPELLERFRVTDDPGWDVAGPLAPLQRDGGWTFSYAQFNASTGEGRVVAVGERGVAWRSEPIITAGSGQGYTTVDDLDGDGQDDVIGSLRGLVRFFDGASGVQLGTASATHSLLPVNVRGRAGAITTVSAASYHAMEGLSLARPLAANTLATWSVTLPERFYANFAATLSCPSGLVLANAGFQAATLVVVDVATGATRSQALFARGRRFESEAALFDAGVLPGSLGNATGLQALWPGQSAVLVGSTDGYLYAVDACASGAPLLWAMNLRAPVGEVVTGDLDGDGQQELVVTAADGFLYGIGPQRFPAPAQVREIDPLRPDAGELDESERPGVLTAEWDAVPGAVGYEWALLTAGGTPVTRHPSMPGNPFIPSPAGETRASFSSMLREGARYVFAVRAVGPGGVSPETLSDGVRYRPVREAPDAGAAPMDAGVPLDAGAVDAGTTPSMQVRGGSGCGCQALEPGWLVGGGLLLSWRRRRYLQQ